MLSITVSTFLCNTWINRTADDCIINVFPRLGYLTFIDTIKFAIFVFAGLVVLVNVIYRRMEVLGREEMARHLDNLTIWIYPFTLVALVAAF